MRTSSALEELISPHECKFFLKLAQNLLFFGLQAWKVILESLFMITVDLWEVKKVCIFVIKYFNAYGKQLTGILLT